MRNYSSQYRIVAEIIKYHNRVEINQEHASSNHNSVCMAISWLDNTCRATNVRRIEIAQIIAMPISRDRGSA